ncbi:magnesium transporter NIPA-domain-containing protein [Clohesyomyces aquaticus]|uniref:Magnesium transporter NIPA-domain-containing protein n=1 Tax=Clohesyomyces aquaticus TaxID=1231657 RepID=A0A1Y1YJN2_9PLEO|nr:magnesium transporter NIPA-domain-containing protein [Clohesyomyces aquaticus]
MILPLPPTFVAAGTATATATTTTTTTLDHGSPTPSPTPTSSLPSIPGIGGENWSSLIGITTAIIGNVLISFALNMQRYAHIRLEREWQEKERQRKRRSTSYRATQAKIAAERAKANLARKYSDPSHMDGPDRGYGPTEADPLIPSLSTRSRSRPTLASADSSSSDGGVSEEAYKQKSYLRSPYWWAGIILMTTGEAGNFLAYGFAPASIVSPLGVVALVSNCIIAPFMLKEPFRKRDGLGVLVAVAGAVTVVLSASDNNPKLGPEEIWDLIRRWEFETYLGITIAVIVALSFASDKYGGKSILIDLGLVGLFGGYTALSTKGVASMLSYTLWRAITFPVTYLLVAVLVFTAVMQIKYINRALQRFDATQVIPVQFVMFTLSVILGSAILYRDFERTDSGDAGKFVGGCAMTFLGVWLITSGRPRNRDGDDENREPEPEDAINLVDGERYQDELDDTADEDIAASSRRSSTIRAASPPVPITTRRLPSRDGSLPHTPSTPLDSVPETPPDLTENPWGRSHEASPSDSPSLRPPPTSRHTPYSTPLPPSEATTNTASISNPELTASTSGYPNPPIPHTPTRGISDTGTGLPPTTPGTGPQSNTLPHRLRRMGTAERVRNRDSIPGPLLASPLSTSLSAMVADLKRGGSLRSRHSHSGTGGETSNGGDGNGNTQTARRRESVLGIGAGEQGYGGRDEEVGEPLDRRRTADHEHGYRQEERRDEGRGTRGRSLSGTLGELWRGFRGGEVEGI